MHILLIQGNCESRDSLQALLEGAGHQVTVSTDSDEAELLATDVDMVLINVDELYEMGCAFAQCLRQKGVRTPIMMLSNADTFDEKMHTVNIGVDDYLARPISDAVLLGRIQILVKRAA